MELIDKSALVEEIRKRLLPVVRDKHYDEWEEGQDSERIAILDIINTIEVKEVDLDKEISKFSMELAAKENNGDWLKDITITAKHFYELGLKTKREFKNKEK